MHVDVAIIGRILPAAGNAIEIPTPYGRVRAMVTEINKRSILAISRHGDSHLPPHRVNYRALIHAASIAPRIIAINTVGSMISAPGSFFIPTDFVEFTKSRISTFYEDRAVHVDMSEPYCPEIRSALVESCRAKGYEPYEGVYVCTEGPHLETPAQIKMFKSLGDVVGMTGYPEVVLAKELALCYASICLVTNSAGDGPIDISQIQQVAERARDDLGEIIAGAISRLPQERSCRCRNALENAEL